MTIRIVLADDHRMMCDGLTALLKKEPGFEIVGEAHDGLGAVQLARDLAPDVLVTDLAMPGMNGIEAIRRVRAESPAVQVLPAMCSRTRHSTSWPWPSARSWRGRSI